MQIIDLRDKSNMHIQNAQDIAQIFQSLGKAEQIRQERQMTTRILQAISGGGDVAGAALEPVEFGTGLEGFIQKLGASFAPQVSPMQQAIAARGVQQAFPSPAEKARLEYYKSRRGTTAATAKRTAATEVSKLWEFKRKQRELLVDRKDTTLDEAERERLQQQVSQIDIDMEALTNQLGGSAKETAPAAQVDAVTGADAPTGGRGFLGSAADIAGNILGNENLIRPFPAGIRPTPTSTGTKFDESGFVTPQQQPGEFVKSEQTATSDIEEQILPYIEKLNPESLNELEKVISSGNTLLIKRALQMLRQKYGNVR